MKKHFVWMAIFLLCAPLFSQSFYKTPFAHTYSIVAMDPETGEIGAAVQSHWFSVGSIVIWGEAGVGAVATQSFVNVSYGPRALELLKQGYSPKEVVEILTNYDDGRAFRQLGIVDAKGNSAAYTGDNCIPEAGHIEKQNYAIQANLMLKNTVWGAMEKAFTETKGPLAERMVAALEAAEAEGGDIRGKQSAAILVVKGKSSGKVWEDRMIDLRIEDHPEPIKEIRRLLNVYRAYEHMNAGDVAVEHNDMDGALREYGAAQKMFPDNLEMKYWTAISLANGKRLEEALPIFQDVFKGDANWKTLTPRLLTNGLLQVSEAELKRIMGN